MVGLAADNSPVHNQRRFGYLLKTYKTIFVILYIFVKYPHNFSKNSGGFSTIPPRNREDQYTEFFPVMYSPLYENRTKAQLFSLYQR
jgi:uncharacterized protein Veg